LVAQLFQEQRCAGGAAGGIDDQVGAQCPGPTGVPVGDGDAGDVVRLSGDEFTDVVLQ
jgi:hypothetical protein